MKYKTSALTWVALAAIIISIAYHVDLYIDCDSRGGYLVKGVISYHCVKN